MQKDPQINLPRKGDNLSLVDIRLRHAIQGPSITVDRNSMFHRFLSLYIKGMLYISFLFYGKLKKRKKAGLWLANETLRLNNRLRWD